MGFMFLIYVFCIDLFVGFYDGNEGSSDIYTFFFRKDRKSLNIREGRVPCVSYCKIQALHRYQPLTSYHVACWVWIVSRHEYKTILANCNPNYF
jgi:hypothetical protein